MNRKKHILTAKYLSGDGKSLTDEQLFSGTTEEAHEAAKKLHDLLIGSGCRRVRVETWEVVAMSYKGTIRTIRG